MNKKLKDIQDKILTTYKIIDPSGHNYNKLKDLFDKMTDKEFESYVKNKANDPEDLFYIEFLSYKNEPNIEDIKKAAKYLHVPLEEYIYRKDLITGKLIKSKYKVPIMILYIKKQQQLLSKKNSYTTSVDNRSQKFNQVADEDKAARITRPELFSMSIIGAKYGLQEMLGPRADNYNKEEFYQKLSQDEYVYLKDLETDESQMLNIVDVYLLAMGLKSDLISNSYVISKKEDLMRNINLQKRNAEFNNKK